MHEIKFFPHFQEKIFFREIFNLYERKQLIFLQKPLFKKQKIYVIGLRDFSAFESTRLF